MSDTTVVLIVLVYFAVGFVVLRWWIPYGTRKPRWSDWVIGLVAWLPILAVVCLEIIAERRKRP